MKTLRPFLLFAFIVLLGCKNKPISDVNEVSDMTSIDSQISEINKEIAEAVKFHQQLLSHGYTIESMENPIMLTDVANAKAAVANLKAAKANLEILKANLESSDRLIQSIEQFDKSSTKLSNKMLWLTRIIAFLTFVLLVVAIIQIKETSTLQRLYQKMTTFSLKNTEPESTTTTNKVKEGQEDSVQQSKLSGVEEEQQEPEEPELPIEDEPTID